jgi:hypothetical protein
MNVGIQMVWTPVNVNETLAMTSPRSCEVDLGIYKSRPRHQAAGATSPLLKVGIDVIVDESTVSLTVV